MTRFRLYITLLLLVLFASCNMAPGTEVYAERYDIDVPIERFENAIRQFKELHKEYVLPTNRLPNGKWDSTDFRYNVFFYYAEEDQIATCYFSGNEEVTNFVFVAVSNNKHLSKWNLINKDFEREENERQKKKFEELILNPIINLAKANMDPK